MQDSAHDCTRCIQNVRCCTSIKYVNKMVRARKNGQGVKIPAGIQRRNHSGKSCGKQAAGHPPLAPPARPRPPAPQLGRVAASSLASCLTPVTRRLRPRLYIRADAAPRPLYCRCGFAHFDSGQV
jgi:hypothetical protein